jgi:hypothetical protein
MFQYPPAGRNNPDTSALPSMMNVIGLLAEAPAIAALIRGPSSVADPFLSLFRPVLKSQSRAQPICDARIYFIPGTGTGAGTTLKHGMGGPYSTLAHPRKGRPHADAAARKPAPLTKPRLSIKGALIFLQFDWELAIPIGDFRMITVYHRINLGSSLRETQLMQLPRLLSDFEWGWFHKTIDQLTRDAFVVPRPARTDKAMPVVLCLRRLRIVKIAICNLWLASS